MTHKCITCACASVWVCMSDARLCGMNEWNRYNVRIGFRLAKCNVDDVTL